MGRRRSSKRDFIGRCWRSELSGMLDCWMDGSGSLSLLTSAATMQIMRLIISLLILLVSISGQAGEGMRCVRDVEFARVGEQALKLDVYIPAGKARAPL